MSTTESVTGPKEHTYRGVNPPPLTHRSQWLSLVTGLAFTGGGIAGFFAAHDHGFAENPGANLLGFEVNHLHNLVHLVIGLAGLALWRSVSGARLFGLLLLAGYGAAVLYGVVAVDASWDPLTLNWTDNGLHLASMLVGGYIASSAHTALQHGSPYQ